MLGTGDIASNAQEAVAKGRGSLAINAAAYANVTIYQYVTYAEGPQAADGAKSSLCPYPGLETFQISEARFFAGREDKLAELVASVDAHTISGSIAASGAGKSSLVHAGLIPALGARENEHWDVFAVRPGQDPLYGLARSLSGVLADGGNLNDQLDEIESNAVNLRKTPGRLSAYVEEVIRRRSTTTLGKRHRVLFFVDQWEELYAQRKITGDKEIFIREILDVTERGLAKLLFTLRIDFMPDLLLGNRAFFDRVKPGICYLEPMHEIERRAAIEKPAQAVGLKVPEQLTSRLVADTGDNDGSLAYLQFVLRRLWEERDKATNSLTTKAYDGMKGLKGAIGEHASRVFRGLTKPEEELAERIIPRLVNIVENSTVTSRRLPFALFDKEGRDLLRKLAEPDKRLIVLSAATKHPKDTDIIAEVAHEALLREWKELRGWINDREEFYRMRNKLEDDAKTWEENNYDHSYLTLRGKSLINAKEVINKANSGEITYLCKWFIEKNISKNNVNRVVLFGSALLVLITSISGVVYFSQLSSDLLIQRNTAVAISDLARKFSSAETVLERFAQVCVAKHMVVESTDEGSVLWRETLDFALLLDSSIGNFEKNRMDRVSSNTINCNPILRVKKSADIWSASPERAAANIRHLEVERFLLAYKMLDTARSLIIRMIGEQAIAEVELPDEIKLREHLMLLCSLKDYDNCVY